MELERTTENTDQRGLMEEDRERMGESRERASVVVLTIHICTVESNRM